MDICLQMYSTRSPIINKLSFFQQNIATDAASEDGQCLIAVVLNSFLE